MAAIERGKTNAKEPAARGQPYQSPFTQPNQQTYGEVIGNPQLRRWAVRGGVAAVAGVLFALVFDIRVGITAAILAAVVDTVRRARMHSSVEEWRKPSAAERRTERQLRRLEKNGWRILHARAVPRDEENVSDGRIDHLVIGPSGVYAIDSEKWDRRLPVRAKSHRKLYHGPFNKKERLDEARWEADQASRLISAHVGFEVPVQPSVAIYGPAIPWKVLTVREVDVYSGARARKYLSRRPETLKQTDIERILKVAEKMIPPKYSER